jgi:hypothetical protein
MIPPSPRVLGCRDQRQHQGEIGRTANRISLLQNHLAARFVVIVLHLAPFQGTSPGARFPGLKPGFNPRAELSPFGATNHPQTLLISRHSDLSPFLLRVPLLLRQPLRGSEPSVRDSI